MALAVHIAAIRIGGEAGARIVMLPADVPPVFSADLAGIAMNRLADAAVAASDRRLDRLHRRLKDAVSALPSEVGAPVPLILKQARRVHADVIVMGSHGHGAAYDLAVGSVARGILKRAPCPVLVVPLAPAGRRPRAR